MNVKWYLSKFKWYRRFKGGIWYQLSPKPYLDVYGVYWTQRKALYNEDVLKVEMNGLWGDYN